MEKKSMQLAIREIVSDLSRKKTEKKGRVGGRKTWSRQKLIIAVRDREHVATIAPLINDFPLYFGVHSTMTYRFTDRENVLSITSIRCT